MRARPNEVDLTFWSSTLCEPKLLLHLLDVLDRSQSTADTAASVQTASKWWENNGWVSTPKICDMRARPNEVDLTF